MDKCGQVNYVFIGMKSPKTPGRRGRPRAFKEEEALEKATCVFWRKGFEGTSLSDLTEAMGINRPSLYAAFGNKEELFRKVMDRYGRGPASHVCEAMEARTAREVAERCILGTADLLCDPSHPPGCLGVNAFVAGADEAVREDMAARRFAVIEALRKRFVRARKEGDLPAGADPSALAMYISTVTQGMSVLAASGAKQADLQQVARLAMDAWPS